MEMVIDLGMCNESIDKRTGKYNKRRCGIFKCPICGKEYKLPQRRGFRQHACRSCAAKKQWTKHGLVYHPLHSIWAGMKARCDNPHNKKYPIYGGKGIKVCTEWHDDFKKFYDDNIDKWKPGLTIDRINSSKGYSPNNVQWVSLSENSARTSRNAPIVQLTKTYPYEYIAEYPCIVEAAKAIGITAPSISSCLRHKTVSSGGYYWMYKDEYEMYIKQGLEIPKAVRKI